MSGRLVPLSVPVILIIVFCYFSQILVITEKKLIMENGPHELFIVLIFLEWELTGLNLLGRPSCELPIPVEK